MLTFIIAICRFFLQFKTVMIIKDACKNNNNNKKKRQDIQQLLENLHDIHLLILDY